MAYDSPATIRRRQVAADNKLAKGKRAARKPRLTTWLTDAEWDLTCDFHVGQIHEKSNYPDSAGAHARALVHSAVLRRATRVMGARGLRSVWKAVLIARHELLNTEVA